MEKIRHVRKNHLWWHQRLNPGPSRNVQDPACWSHLMASYAAMPLSANRLPQVRISENHHLPYENGHNWVKSSIWKNTQVLGKIWRSSGSAISPEVKLGMILCVYNRIILHIIWTESPSWLVKFASLSAQFPFCMVPCKTPDSTSFSSHFSHCAFGTFVVRPPVTLGPNGLVCMPAVCNRREQKPVGGIHDVRLVGARAPQEIWAWVTWLKYPYAHPKNVAWIVRKCWDVNE